MAQQHVGSAGYHHITVLGRDPRANAAFYVGVLGQRLIKRTVNYDDPGTWHLYYADAVGSPGSVMTFFPNPMTRDARRGVGEAGAVAYAAPVGSLGWWRDRLKAAGVQATEFTRFDQPGLAFTDHDSTPLEIIETPLAERSWFVPLDPAAPDASSQAAHGGPVPQDMALRGFHSATLDVDGYEHSAALLTDVLGFTLVGNELDRFRFARQDDTGSPLPAATIDLRCRPALQRARMGAGSVHHIAWRASDDQHELAIRAALIGKHQNPTPVIDRQYFHSIYFREPGGVIYEIATDQPGFAIDESVDTLGRSVMLPRWLEPQREAIVRALPPM
jgi:glyoxalase family protein